MTKSPSHSKPLSLQLEERDTVLAALRFWQRNGLSDNPENMDTELYDIATNGGETSALSRDDIDDLCERLNLGDETAPVSATVWVLTEHYDMEDGVLGVFATEAAADQARRAWAKESWVLQDAAEGPYPGYEAALEWFDDNQDHTKSLSSQIEERPVQGAPTSESTIEECAPVDTGPKITYVCAACGSEDIKADAYAVWNSVNQEWDLTGDPSDKNSYCENCGGVCRIRACSVEREYTLDVKLFATARVTATSENEARDKLSNYADCLDIGFASPDGVKFTEASALDDDVKLIEIDGEAV